MGIRAFVEGRTSEAIVFLEYATRFNPDDYRAWLTLARAYQRDGQSKQAAEAFANVVSGSGDPDLVNDARLGIGSLDEACEADRDRLQRLAVQHFEGLPPMRLDRLSVFIEPEPGADFQLIEQFGFAR